MIEYRTVEDDQNNKLIAEYAEAFVADGYTVGPIVVVGNDWILDGHHRYLAAQAAGVEPAISPITTIQHATLVAAGYDGVEIAACAHILAGHDDAIDALAAQFAGAPIFDRAYDAYDLLMAA